MFERPIPRVLVAGSGPVGLFAALSLARRGVKPWLIDESWRGATHSYALALHPSSLELLDDLGLAKKVLKGARRLTRVALYEGKERVGELDLGKLETRFPFIAVLPQAELEDLMIDALQAEGIEVQWNRRLALIKPVIDGVEVTLETLAKEAQGYVVAHEETVVESVETMTVPFLLGADGHESLTRTQLRVGFDEVRPAQQFAVFEVEDEEEVADEMRIALDDRSTNVLWPMPDGRHRWSFQLGDDVHVWEDSREKDRLLRGGVGGPSFLNGGLLAKMVAERAPWFGEEKGAMRWRTAVKFDYGLARSFGKGRAWLAGEAGHATGPVGMQSMNVGLREAARLAEIFAGILEGSMTMDALAAYDKERHQEWQRLLGIGEERLVPTERASAWVRSHADRLSPLIPGGGAAFEQLVGQLGIATR